MVLLGEYSHLNTGDEVSRTGRVMDDVVSGDGLLGRVIDPIGRPMDGKGTIPVTERLPIERPAPSIMGPGRPSQYLSRPESRLLTRLFPSDEASGN